MIHGAGGKEVGQYRLELTLRDYVAERRARAERDGKPYQPDQKVKNLERMIEFFKTVDFRERVR